MNQKLLNDLALETGGAHFPAVFHHYQKDYVLNVLSEIQKVLHEVPFDAYAIDFWDDVVKHFQLDNYEIDKLLKRNS
jgi:hypothetical protein